MTFRRILHALSAAALLLFAGGALADGSPPIPQDGNDPLYLSFQKLEKHYDDARVGDTYRVYIKSLNVGQFSVGKTEARKRSFKFADWWDNDQHSLTKYLETKHAKVVLGPDGSIWLVDGHHLATALDMADVDTMAVDIVADYRRASWGRFYRAMEKRKFIYTVDEDGHRQPPSKLRGMGIQDLRNDPFRSEVWELIYDGVIAKTKTPFAEFQWAEFFRERIPRWLLKAKPGRARRLAIELAGSVDAGEKRLPGYISLEGRCILGKLKRGV